MNPVKMDNQVSTLRPTLSKAEKLINEGISLLREGRQFEVGEKFNHARQLYEQLKNLTTDEKILLLLDRRIKGRIDRILRGIEQTGRVEYFEELNNVGERTGHQEVSTIAHLKGMRHASVNVLIFNQHGQALLQLRAPTTPVFPGKWTFSASGHVASGQNPKDAAMAEVPEELSVPIAPEEETNLPGPIREHIETEDDGIKWLRFHPKDENLLPVGRENSYDGYLYAIEFTYLDDTEKQQVMGAVEQHLGQQTEYGIVQILWDVDESANTLLLFTFDPQQRNGLNRAVGNIEEATHIPRGMLTDNVEKKSLYIYQLAEDEEPVIEEVIKLRKKKGKLIGPGLTSGFQWVDLDQTVRDFNKHPESYTDAFVPFLSDQTIVDEIKASFRQF